MKSDATLIKTFLKSSQKKSEKKGIHDNLIAVQCTPNQDINRHFCEEPCQLQPKAFLIMSVVQHTADWGIAFERGSFQILSTICCVRVILVVLRRLRLNLKPRLSAENGHSPFLYFPSAALSVK